MKIGFKEFNFFYHAPSASNSVTFPGQFFRKPRQRLALRARQIRADVNERVADHVLVEQQPARGAFARDDVRGDADPVILRSGDVSVQVAQPFTMVGRNHAADDNVAAAACGEAVGAVSLQPLAQRLRDRVAEPRLKRLIVERQDFNRLFAADTASGLTGPR